MSPDYSLTTRAKRLKAEAKALQFLSELPRCFAVLDCDLGRAGSRTTLWRILKRLCSMGLLTKVRHGFYEKTGATN